jgi:apolipoprotein N-acyltransferase
VKPRLAYPVAVLSGVALSFAFPEPSFSWIAWIGFVPTIALTRDGGPRRGALAWGLFALGFFGTLLSWVSIAGWIAWAVLLVVETPFVMLFGALWGWLAPKTGPLGRIALAGAGWAGFEYLRSIFPVGGFTWGQLAQSQHDVTWMLEWAALGGGVVLAGILVALNAALVEVATAPDHRSRLQPGAVVVAAFVIPIVSSFFYAASDVTPLRIGLVQGNADPAIAPSYEKELGILASHAHLTEELQEKVDVVVWPESSIGIDPNLDEAAEALESAASATDAPMIVGGNERVDDRRYRVSAFHVDESGTIVDRYRKTHLVPFGEYVPYRGLFGSLPILDQVPLDAIPGDEGKLFRVRGIDIAPVISFEGDFGSLVRSRIADGGDILLVATNTSTWLHSWASAQHVAFSQVRAAENATPVVHAAISGISAIISDRGEVVESLPLYEPRSLVRAVAPRTSVTPYTRFGDWILLVGIVLCAAVWEAGRRGVASPDV